MRAFHGDDARRDLAKCLKRGGFPLYDANRVDQTLKRSRKLWRLAAGADDQRSRFALGKALRLDENPVVGRAALREVDHGRGCARLRRDGDELRRRRLAAGVLLAPLDIIDHGEIGLRRIVGHGDAHSCQRGIVGEADMEVGVPGRRSDLEGLGADGDAGARAFEYVDTGDDRSRDQGNSRDQNLQTQSETQHGTHSLKHKPGTHRVYGWQSVKRTRYRLVDGKAFQGYSSQNTMRT